MSLLLSTRTLPLSASYSQCWKVILLTVLRLLARWMDDT